MKIKWKYFNTLPELPFNPSNEKLIKRMCVSKIIQVKEYVYKNDQLQCIRIETVFFFNRFLKLAFVSDRFFYWRDRFETDHFRDRLKGLEKRCPMGRLICRSFCSRFFFRQKESLRTSFCCHGLWASLGRLIKRCYGTSLHKQCFLSDMIRYVYKRPQNPDKQRCFSRVRFEKKNRGT